MRNAAIACLVVAGLIAGLVRANAQPPGCQTGEFGTQDCVAYMPLIQAEPPPLPALVLPPSDMHGFALDETREITNTESAATYRDPAAALAAFQEQGRESSWYVRYHSRTRPIDVSEQVIRYREPAGADAGLDYAVAEERARYAYGELVAEPLGDRAVGMATSITSDGVTYIKEYFAIRKGRTIAIVQILAPRYTVVDYSAIVTKAANRLP
jgi:hypothetical protein